MSEPIAMSLKEQAEFLEYMAGRCVAASPGMVATETIFHITAEEAASLQYIADRLHQMVPHASRIRDVVLGS